MKVKVGDNVKVLAGKDKGKEGKIIKTLKDKNKVVVEGVNIIKKHLKPRYTNETGSIVEVEAPIHVSNVKVMNDDKKTKEVKTTKEVKAKKEVKATKETKTTKKASTSRKSKES